MIYGLAVGFWGRAPGGTLWKRKVQDRKFQTFAEVRPAALAFHQVQSECGVSVRIERGELALACWCERCKDLRPCAMGKGQDWGPAA
jgi:hypothetical protein